jgi:hypothetical protein
MRRHWKLILGILIVVVLAIGAVGYLWLTNIVDPMPEAEMALGSDEDVTVTTDPWLTFSPSEAPTTGLIFYPGARVPAEAYAPPIRTIAEAGYLAVVPSMPFGLAVLAPDTATDIIAANPGIDHWVIGGHSLGGAMAGQYADGRSEIDGLVLWAAYPPGGVDLSGQSIEVGSVYASEDGLTSIEEIEASRAQLPPDTAFVQIEGGNHAGFGWYGKQDGDGVATISRTEQQAQAVEATLDVLASAEAG